MTGQGRVQYRTYWCSTLPLPIACPSPSSLIASFPRQNPHHGFQAGKDNKVRHSSPLVFASLAASHPPQPHPLSASRIHQHDQVTLQDHSFRVLEVIVCSLIHASYLQHRRRLSWLAYGACARWRGEDWFLCRHPGIRRCCSRLGLCPGRCEWEEREGNARRKGKEKGKWKGRKRKKMGKVGKKGRGE